jgi:hypothetical protein
MDELSKWNLKYKEIFGDWFPSVKYPHATNEELITIMRVAIETGVREELEDGVSY